MQCSLELKRCFNCGIQERKGNTVLISDLSANHQNILSQWAGRHLFEDAKVCLGCVTKMEKCENDESPERQFGHPQVCVGCGKSIMRKSFCTKSSDFLEVLFPWCKQYKEVKPGLYMTCVACHSRVGRKIVSNQKAKEEAFCVNKTNEADNQSSEVLSLEANKAIFHNNHLILTKHSRAALSCHKCVVPKCTKKGKPLSSAQRKLILKQYDIYLCRHATLCESHRHYKFHEKFDYQYFSIENIEDMLSMMEKQVSILNFDCINDMPEHICKYWTGLTVEEFKDLYEKLNIDTGNGQSLRPGAH